MGLILVGSGKNSRTAAGDKIENQALFAGGSTDPGYPATGFDTALIRHRMTRLDQVHVLKLLGMSLFHRYKP